MLNAGICNTLHADMDCDARCRAQGLCGYLVLLLPDSIDKGIICQPSNCFSAIVNSEQRLYACSRSLSLVTICRAPLHKLLDSGSTPASR